MKRSEPRITQFVRGMAWHDIGKPFHLGTHGHIWLGYWLLYQAGYPDEGVIALTHGAGSSELASYFKEGGRPIPALFLLNDPLDKLSASIYSLLSRRFKTNAFLGKNEDTIERKNPLFHAWQNPFSRLPIYSNDLEKPLIIRESYNNASVPDNRKRQLDEALKNRLLFILPDSWASHLRDDIDGATNSKVALAAKPGSDLNGNVLMDKLLRFQVHYPERTYPPANDTTLQEHCRLGGALAYVLHRNLAQDRPEWLASKRVWQSGDIIVLGKEDDTEEVTEFLNPRAPELWNDARKITCKHMDASLVRIAFEGQRELFENAVRVDDLLGTRALTERFLDQFEEHLADVLGVPDLMWGSEGDNRQCLLTIHRSQFDLFYVLPPHPTGDGVTTIEEVVHSAYEETLKKIVDELLENLKRDFRKAAGELSFDDEAKGALRNQLRNLSYRVRILDLDVTPADEIDTFADFTSEYGTALVDNFRDSREHPIVPPADLPLQAKSEEDVRLSADKTCDVCGNHPIFEPFVKLLDDEEWKPYVQKVVHHFREEPELPCISCIARRILSHGVVAGETLWLDEMVDWADAETGGGYKLIAKKTEKSPATPPLLMTSSEFKDEDDFLDLGAAYARYRQRNDHYQLELFPTIGYAADANSNVVLLALQPTAMLQEAYDYTHSIKEIGNLPEAVKRGDRTPESDRERWQASVSLVYDWAKEHQPEIADNMLAIKPHLARVMERIRRVQIFYRDLKDALETEPMRVLPLDVNFPTLRLLLPADQLDQALRVLDRVVTETLFSATHYEDWEERREAHEFLKLIVPDLLHGTVVLFKQKFPLYLALEAERDVFHQLEASDPNELANERTRPGNSQWYGFRLGFSDLRGSLSEVGPIQAEVTYENLGEVLNLVDKVDRRTVLQYKQTEQYISLELAEAQALVRTRRVQGLRPSHIEALGDEERELFKPVHFIKRAIRR